MTRPNDTRMPTAADADVMRAAAASVEDAGNAVHALQTILTERVNAATLKWPPEVSSDFMRAYLSFDRDISRIQASLDQMHGALTASCARVSQGVATR